MPMKIIRREYFKYLEDRVLEGSSMLTQGYFGQSGSESGAKNIRMRENNYGICV